MTAEDKPGSFLGVDCSLRGRRWVKAQVEQREIDLLHQRLGISQLTAEILIARGQSLETAPDFLAPSLRNLMPDPSTLMGMDRAVERIVQAIERGERLAIFGDYDVDGATSTALLQRFLRPIGIEPLVYIPNRLTEGYGPNAEAFAKLKRDGAELVILVDCGTTAFDALDAAAAQGLEAVIIDHHQAEPRLPVCAALVNPNQLDDTSGLGALAACGLTFMTLVALNRALREAGYYDRQGVKAANLLALLDLVALGTICDVVPLVGLNRALAAQGLKVMGQAQNAGIAALLLKGAVNEAPEAYHAGFVLGPRINAGGGSGFQCLVPSCCPRMIPTGPPSWPFSSMH